MEHRFKPGDFLFFQIESGFALVRVLEIEGSGEETVWHLSTYNDLFPDVELLENAVSAPDALSVSIPHVALTNRAFESTQVADIGHSTPTDRELAIVESWKRTADHNVSDLSIRLLTGLR